MSSYAQFDDTTDEGRQALAGVNAAIEADDWDAAARHSMGGFGQYIDLLTYADRVVTFMARCNQITYAVMWIWPGRMVERIKITPLTAQSYTEQRGIMAFVDSVIDSN